MRLQKKRFILVIATVLMCCMMSITAFSYEVPDMSREGSVNVTMQQGETIVAGGSLTIYRAGEIHEEDGNYSFCPAGDFAACGEKYEDIQSAELAKTLAAYAKDHQLEGTTKKVGSDGIVSFENLKTGLYLAIQNEAADGYNKAEPFLISVPMLENNVYVYDVDASPKVDIKKESEPVEPEPSVPSGPKLPQTGQLNWPIPVLVVSGLCLFAIGWILRFGKRKDSYA